MKPIIVIALAAVMLSACGSKKQASPALLEFVKEFDGKNLQEAKEILREENDRVTHFISFMENFDKEKSKSYKTTEEEFSAPYQLKSAAIMEAKYATYLTGIGIKQEISYPGSVVGVDGAFKGNSALSDIDAPDFTSAKIFYHDGSSEEKKYTLDGSSSIPSVKTIDSILTDVSYNYAVNTTVLTLDKEHNKRTYKGAEVKIDKLSDNCVKLLMGDSVFSNYLYVEALNKDGKPLDYSSRNSGGNNADDMNRLLVDYNKGLKALIKKLDKGAYKDVAALQKDIIAQMPGGSPFDEGGSGYTEGYYRGNVAKVNVYMADNRNTVKKQLTLKNMEPNYAGLTMAEDKKSDNYGFVDATGKYIIPATYKKLEQLNPFFFTNNDYNGYYYYRLDTASRKLVKIAEVATALTSQLATVQKEKTEESYGVMDANGQLIIPMTYSAIYFDANEQLIYANKIEEDGPLQGLTTIYDINGHAVMPEPYYVSATYSEGLLLVRDKKGKNYFIDNKGKKIIDLNGYVDFEPFSDGLALVKDEHRNYGFINAKGMLVIPCIYTDVTPFSLGISMVSRKNSNDETETALINTKNEIIVPFTPATSSGKNWDGVERTYTIGDKKFDAWGKEIK